MVRHDLFLVPLFALTLSVFQPFYLADALEYIPEHIEECVYKQIDHVDNFVDCKYSNTEDNVCQRNFKKLWKKLTRSRQGKAPVCSKEYPPSDPIISVVEACKSASFREQQCDKLTDAFLGLAHGDIDKDVCEDDKIRCPDGSYVSRNPKNNCKFYDCPVEKCSGSKKYCWDGSYVEQDPYDYCRYPDCPDCSGKKKYCPGGSYVYQDPDDDCRSPDCPRQSCSGSKKYCWDGSYVEQDPLS
uniref:ShKT domain-containing protein n=1 Tax=Ditylum brightwellii TaxID=49249 RepID=A0A7S4R1L4_9STRA